MQKTISFKKAMMWIYINMRNYGLSIEYLGGTTTPSLIGTLAVLETALPSRRSTT